MTQREPREALEDMLHYALRAYELGHGKSADEIAEDKLLELAIPRALEIAGEAASRLTPENQETYDAVPWRSIAGLRNRLAHGYDRIDFKIVERIVNDDLPPLIEALEAILSAIEED